MWQVTLRSCVMEFSSGVFTIGPLGPNPPLNCEKISHRPYGKNATLVKLTQLKIIVTTMYQMSDFKAKIHQIRFWLGLHEGGKWKGKEKTGKAGACRRSGWSGFNLTTFRPNRNFFLLPKYISPMKSV